MASPTNPRRRLLPRACDTSSPPPATRPATSTVQRSQGRKSALRTSSVNDHTAVRKGPRREQAAGHWGVASLPQQPETDADQRSDRRGKGDRVVRVEGP